MNNKKPIIIDGVDIGECKHYERHSFYDCNETCEDNGAIVCTNCEDNPDCYFKQLARKTQECEELKKQLMQKDEVNTFFNTPAEGWSSNPCDVCENKNNYDRYRKALEEIEAVLKICVNGDCVKCSLRNASLSCVLTIQTNILDIINKAKGGEDEKI